MYGKVTIILTRLQSIMMCGVISDRSAAWYLRSTGDHDTHYRTLPYSVVVFDRAQPTSSKVGVNASASSRADTARLNRGPINQHQPDTPAHDQDRDVGTLATGYDHPGTSC